MSVRVEVKWDKSQIAALATGPLKGALKRALNKAGRDALRAMQSDATKRIRARKRIKPRYIRDAITLVRPHGGDISSMEWDLNVSGKPVPLIAYPHRAVKGKLGKRRTGPRSPGGMIVEVNVGKQTFVRGAFVATMDNGHQGIFRRRGAKRNPIYQLLGSRPVDALLHHGEADGVAARGGEEFAKTFERVLPLEIGKSKGGE